MNKFYVIGLVFSIFFCNTIYGQEEVKYFNLYWEADMAETDGKRIAKFETNDIPHNEIVRVEVWRKNDNQLIDYINIMQGMAATENGIWKYSIEFYGRNEIKEFDDAIIHYVIFIKYNNITISSELIVHK
jgi:hypothetical protein